MKILVFIYKIIFKTTKKLQNLTQTFISFGFNLSFSFCSVSSYSFQKGPKKLRTLKPLQITKNKETTSDKTAIHRLAIFKIASKMTKNFIPRANVIF